MGLCCNVCCVSAVGGSVCMYVDLCVWEGGGGLKHAVLIGNMNSYGSSWTVPTALALYATLCV